MFIIMLSLDSFEYDKKAWFFGKYYLLILPKNHASCCSKESKLAYLNMLSVLLSSTSTSKRNVRYPVNNIKDQKRWDLQSFHYFGIGFLINGIECQIYLYIEVLVIRKWLCNYVRECFNNYSYKIFITKFITLLYDLIITLTLIFKNKK